MRRWRAVYHLCSSPAVPVINLPLQAQAANAQGNADIAAFAVVFLIIFLVAIAVYFIPSFVAFARGHPNRWLILVINTVFGATGLGWLGSLVWACNAIHRPRYGSDGGQSGLNLFVNDARQLTVVPSASLPIDEIARLKTLLDDAAINFEDSEGLKRRLLRQHPIDPIAEQEKIRKYQ